MRILGVAFTFLFTLAVSAQEPPEPFSEQTFVTAIELTIKVTDETGHTPTDLTPSDFTVLENGVERPVIGVERIAPPAPRTDPGSGTPSPTEAPNRWEVVVWLDSTTMSQSTLRHALPELESRADELTNLGPVTLIWGSPYAELLVEGTESEAELADALRKLQTRSTSDQIAMVRRRALEQSDVAPPLNPTPGARGGARRNNSLEGIAAVQEEVRILQLSRAALLGWIGKLPRRTPRALFLVGDGFDLDPSEFYVDLIESSGASTRRIRSRLEQYGQAGEHHEMARALAVEGWTVIGVGGSGAGHFPDEASRSGGRRMSDFLGSDAGARPPGLLMAHPRDPFLEIADATGGAIVPHAGKLDEAMDDLRNRIILTYQVTRAPDAEPRKVEVEAVRRGLQVTAPKWASSTPAASVAEARAQRLLGLGRAEQGDLPVRMELSMQPANRKGIREGVARATIDFSSLRHVAAGVGPTLLRVTVAVGGDQELPVIVQETVPLDLSRERTVQWSAPLVVEAEKGRVAIVFEELTTGAWGGAVASLERVASSLPSQAPPVANREVRELVESEWLLDPDEARKQAGREGKPILALVFTSACTECITVAKEAMRHPAIARKLDAFVPLLIDGGSPQSVEAEPSILQDSIAQLRNTSHFLVLDLNGREHFRLSLRTRSSANRRGIIPTELSDFLERTRLVAPLLVEGATHQAEGRIFEAMRAFALTYRRAGELEKAAEAFDRVRDFAVAAGDRIAAQSAEVLLGLVHLQGKNAGEAMRLFEEVERDPASPLNRAEALLGIGQVRRSIGDEKGASEAFVEAARVAPEGSEAQAAAMALAGASADLARGAVAVTPESSIEPLQLVVEGRPPFSGSVEAQALIRHPDVDEVAFLLDDQEVVRDASPPFVARIALGSSPQARKLSASAWDSDGTLVARDVLTLNERHDQFWVHATAKVQPDRIATRIEIGEPLGGRVETVDLFLDGRLVETLTAAPWFAEIPRNISDTSVLRVVARLHDGRLAEHTVLLNPTGFVETVDVHHVELYATVLQRGGEPMPGLGPSDFTLLENGKPQKIHGFESLERAPWTAGMALDSSGSMAAEMPNVQEAARDFVGRTIDHGGRAFIVDFDGAPRLAHPTSADSKSIFAAIDRITAGGGTALYDAIIFGLLQLQGIDGKRVLVVITDGDDLMSRYDYRGAIRVAQESGATVYAVVIDPGYSIFNRRIDRLRRELETLARVTGGEAWYVRTTAALPDIYDAIDRELRNQYVLTYRTDPPEKPDEWRDVDVRVARPGVRVKAIDGYFAR